MAKMKIVTQDSDSVELECSLFLNRMYIAALVANVDGFKGKKRFDNKLEQLGSLTYTKSAS